MAERLLEQAARLDNEVKTKVKTRSEAIAALREHWDLTDVGAGDVLDRWRDYLSGSRRIAATTPAGFREALPTSTTTTTYTYRQE